MDETTKKGFLELLQEFSEKTLDPKFKKIDSQFIEFREDIIHKFHLISEDVISKVQQVAEGVANVNEELDRTRKELKTEIQETMQEVLAQQSIINLKIGLYPHHR
jgi:hypothetical protein